MGSVKVATYVSGVVVCVGLFACAKPVASGGQFVVDPSGESPMTRTFYGRAIHASVIRGGPATPRSHGQG